MEPPGIAEYLWVLNIFKKVSSSSLEICFIEPLGIEIFFNWSSLILISISIKALPNPYILFIWSIILLK